MTHVCFMNEVLKENEKSSILTFWECITVTLREEFAGAAQSKDLHVSRCGVINSHILKTLI